MRIHTDPKYILVMTVTFNDFEPAIAFHAELSSNSNVYGLSVSGKVVKYHTFDKETSLSLAKNFEESWIENKTIESSQKGMIRYGSNDPIILDSEDVKEIDQNNS